VVRHAHEKEARQLFGADEQHLKDIDYYRTGWDREQTLRAAELAADDLPRVLLTTTQGDIELELFENEAPKTVANHVYLVEQGFYDGLTFYRGYLAMIHSGPDVIGSRFYLTFVPSRTCRDEQGAEQSGTAALLGQAAVTHPPGHLDSDGRRLGIAAARIAAAASVRREVAAAGPSVDPLARSAARPRP
jgi:hypothetical protein